MEDFSTCVSYYCIATYCIAAGKERRGADHVIHVNTKYPHLCHDMYYNARSC